MVPIVAGILVGLAYFWGSSDGSKEKEEQVADTLYRLQVEHQNKEMIRLKAEIERLKSIS